MTTERTRITVQDKNIYYGSMYADNISHVVTIDTTDTFVEIDGDLTAGELNGITFQNDSELIIQVPGLYLINYSISALTASVANKTFESAVLINGNETENATSHAELSPGGSNRPAVLSGHGLFILDVGDIISLGIANHDDATDGVVVHTSCTVVQISR